MSLTVGSLFAGIGGFDLAAQWMGWRTVWHSEIDPYACAVFARHFPESRNVGDVTKWEPTPADVVDVICGGFPCQPVSVAGKRKAQDDERWLWPEFARVLRVLRPRFAVVENVPGLLVRGMGDVLGDLSDLGYDAEWQVVSARSVGAPHLRRRVWIVAYADGERLQTGGASRIGRVRAAQLPDHGSAVEGGSALADSCEQGLEGRGVGGESSATGQDAEQHALRCCRAGWWESEPDVGRVAHGVPARVDRLRCLGNAIVPQVAYAWAFQRVAQLVCGQPREET